MKKYFFIPLTCMSLFLGVFLVDAAFSPPKARAAIPRIARQAQEDIKLGGAHSNLIDLAGNLNDYKAKVQAALKGTLKQTNSTKVTSKDAPFTIAYNASIEFKRPAQKADQRTQPCSIGKLSLVSDDGCNVQVNGEAWLGESGSGHDISAGLREYTKLLGSGKKHMLDIEYSQVYYDPKAGEQDLDGLSIIIQPIIVDISVRKKGDKASMNKRILIKKGSTVEFAINPDAFDQDKDPLLDEQITWEYNKAKGTGVLAGWKAFKDCKGACVSYTFEYGGIYQIRAKIGDEYFLYELRETAPFCYENYLSHKGSPDYVGVTDKDVEVKLVKHAFSFLGSKKYAKAGALNPPLGYGLDPDREDYFESSKCNIFVFVIANDSGALVVPWERPSIHPDIPFFTACIPPLVEKWRDSDFPMKNQNGTCWVWQNPATLDPQPGYVVLGSAHCGIVDYDGAWISAGPTEVNKKISILPPDPARFPANQDEEYKKNLNAWKEQYKLRAMRQFN